MNNIYIILVILVIFLIVYFINKYIVSYISLMTTATQNFNKLKS